MQNNAEGTCRPHPFSIAAILGDEITANNVQPEKKYPVDEYARDGMQEETEQIMMPNIRKDENQSNQRIIASEYSWLHCSRYNPPKVHRSKRRCSLGSRPSRQPRIPFTPRQQETLERNFQTNRYLTSDAVRELSCILNLPGQRIKIWFQNRRARERRGMTTKR